MSDELDLLGYVLVSHGLMHFLYACVCPPKEVQRPDGAPAYWKAVATHTFAFVIVGECLTRRGWLEVFLSTLLG